MGIFEKLNEIGIPKFLWYSVSFSLLAITFVLLWIMFKSQSVNIEVANTKIQLIHTLSDAQSALEDAKKEVQVKPVEVVATTRPTVPPIIVPATKPVNVQNIEKSIQQLQDIRQQMAK